MLFITRFSTRPYKETLLRERSYITMYSLAHSPAYPYIHMSANSNVLANCYPPTNRQAGEPINQPSKPRDEKTNILHKPVQQPAYSPTTQISIHKRTTSWSKHQAKVRKKIAATTHGSCVNQSLWKVNVYERQKVFLATPTYLLSVRHPTKHTIQVRRLHRLARVC